MFTPMTHVGGAFLVGLRCAYAGEFLVVRTVAGSALAITPGHPVATPEGFVPACELGEGRPMLRWLSPRDCAKIAARDAFFALHAGAHQQRRALNASDLYGDAGRVIGDLSFVQPMRSPHREGHGSETDLKAGDALSRDFGREFVERLLKTECCAWDAVSAVEHVPADPEGVGVYGFHTSNGWHTAEQLVVAG